MHAPKGIFFAIAVLASVSCAADTLPAEPRNPLRFNGYVDTYYAYDANRPALRERLYTTQAVRHNEFNVNLAFFDATLDSAKVRGRLALQMGNSVVRNYSGEAAIGNISGPVPSQYLQEAYAGYAINEDFWIDAGIFFSHIGLESFVSRDNMTYSRSMVIDHLPYYQSGVRGSYRISETFSAQLHLMNGWQNISENNDAKSAGVQIAWAPSSEFSLTYNNIAGREANFRHFHDLVAKWQVTKNWQLALQGDLGFQRPLGIRDVKTWYGGTFINQYRFNKRLAVGWRVEGYRDPYDMIGGTGSPHGLSVFGGSGNVDVQLAPNLVWRSELRALKSQDEIFPSQGGLKDSATTAITSLALSL